MALACHRTSVLKNVTFASQRQCNLVRITNFYFSSVADSPSKGEYQKPTMLFKNKARHNSPKTKVKIQQTFSTGPHNIYKAVEIAKKIAWAKFDESVDISVVLNVDPRKPNQAVKGVAQLPHGTGKTVRVCVFARGQEAVDATQAGADVVGDEELINEIQSGNINFDTVIATPSMMSVVAKVGRILGPRGLMPSPKMGTVTQDVKSAVKNAKAGAVKFKVEKQGVLHITVGKRSFEDQQLLENIRAVMIAIMDAKPEGLKGKYFKKASISTTMGKGINLQIQTIDPGHGRFMVNLEKSD